MRIQAPTFNGWIQTSANWVREGRQKDDRGTFRYVSNEKKHINKIPLWMFPHFADNLNQQAHF